MIKAVSLFVCVLSVVALSGCKTTVQDGPTKVIVEDGHHHSGGGFCPPGQAKKGHC